MADADRPPSVGFHPAARRVITFEGYRFDLSDRVLSRDGVDVPLPPRAIGILSYLLERPGRVVSKQELLDAVWKDAHVSETSLTEAVGLLRQTLEDDPQQPRFIQTVHRRGYRFIASVGVEPAVARALAAVPLSGAPDGLAAEAQGVRERSAVTRLLVWRVAALAAGVVAAAGVFAWSTRPTLAPPMVARLVVTLPPEQAPAPGLNAHAVLALAPDGRRLVYVAGQTGAHRLFVRALDRFEAMPIAGTEGGHGPFFSPDGESIGFFGNGRLMRLDIAGGEPLPIAEAKTGFGGSWAADGSVVFAPDSHSALWRVPAAGGDPLRLTDPAEGESHRWPDVLPGRRGVLFTVWRLGARDARIAAWREGDAQPRTIIEDAVHPRYLSSGHLAFVRDGTLMAAPFDIDSLTLTAPPSAVVHGIMTGLTGAGQFSVSASGSLIYLPDDPQRLDRTIARIGIDGRVQPLPLPQRRYQNLALSPDGRLVAATIPAEGTVDIWIGDLSRGVVSRLTAEGTNLEPVWTPDGRYVAYASDRSGRLEMYKQAIDGSAGPQPLLAHPFDAAPGSWSPDGRTLAFFRIAPETRADVMLATEGSSPGELIATRAAEAAPRISPDGRWVAYQANDSGKMEVYVRPIDGSGRLQVSRDGGTSPAWVPGASRLTFRSRAAVIAVEISAGADDAPAAGPEARLIDDPAVILALPARDGSFVVVRRTREHEPLTTVNVVLDWVRESVSRIPHR
jgi:DNA-binding winged helix-turn-helix (wHTH) protein